MKNQSRIISLFLMIVISFAGILGYSADVYAEQISQVTTESVTTAEISESPETGKAGLKKLEKKLKKELKGKQGQWSVYVKNLDTNEYMLINDKKLPSASLIKLYIMMTAYDEVENGSIVKEDSSFNSYMRKMITVSDNESANALTKSLTGKGTFSEGIKKINRYCKEQGYTKTKFMVEMGKSSPKNVTSAKDCGWALERMYRGTAVSSKSSKNMIKFLKSQTRRGKIPAGVPKGVTVANKTGETSFAENDAAIVYSDGADYVIVVMSKNGRGAVTEIQKISKMVYDYFN